MLRLPGIKLAIPWFTFKLALTFDSHNVKSRKKSLWIFAVPNFYGITIFFGQMVTARKKQERKNASWLYF